MVTEWGNHRVQVFAANGAFVRKWGSLGSGHGQFARPRGVAMRGDEVLVADCDNHRLQVFRLDGTFLRTWDFKGLGDSQINSPNGLAVTRTGRILVSDYDTGCVQMLT